VKNHADNDPKQVTMLIDIWLETFHFNLPSYCAEFSHNTVTDSHMTRPKTAS